MGVTREEATVVLGADIGTVERSLGIGKNYFDRWGKQLKSDQEKYTEWWSTELKKREEMEVQSSVRSAQRANLARKLWRGRKEAAGERIAEEIGQGSIPESWQKVSKAAKQAGSEAEEVFTHMGHHARHEIHGAAEIIKSEFGGKVGEIGGILKGFAFGYATVIAFAAIEGWKTFTEFLSNQAYGVDSPISELTGKLRDANREFYRKENEDRWKAAGEKVKATAEARKQAQEQIKLDEQLGDVQSQQQIARQGGTETEEGRNTQRDRINLAVFFRQEELDAAKLRGDRMEQTKAQIALEQAQLEVITFQTEEQRRQKALKKEEADAARERQQIAQGELAKYMPTLQELSHRGIFTSQARNIGRLDRQIKQDFEFGNVGKAKSDLAARDKIYDVLAGKGILPEREEKRRMDELNRKTAGHIAEIAEGKKTIRVKAELK